LGSDPGTDLGSDPGTDLGSDLGTDPGPDLGTDTGYDRAVPSRRRSPRQEGWEGWDEYAPFYDWENARTLGRRDVPFWRRIASRTAGPVLELGCGTGRITFPLARAGVSIVGIDRSAAMLARARSRLRRLHAKSSPPSHSRSHLLPEGPRNSSAIAIESRRFNAADRFESISLVRGDIRVLPFEPQSFPLVIAPYGILQSLIRPADLTATLTSVARVIARDGVFGLDLVPDVPNWREYRNRVQMRGRSNGAQLTLIESVTQDRGRRLTMFEQRYVERRGRTVREHRFALTFRTLTVPQMSRQLERAGFTIESVLGDYRGRAWDPRADVWIILAKKV
jgi:ubiquinone/menaquinone biosynthesis C-methylase UbiE